MIHRHHLLALNLPLITSGLSWLVLTRHWSRGRCWTIWLPRSNNSILRGLHLKRTRNSRRYENAVRKDFIERLFVGDPGEDHKDGDVKVSDETCPYYSSSWT